MVRQTTLSIAVLFATLAVSAGVAPLVGTWFEPWYTARANLHWRIPESSHAPGGADVLFADANGDGRDDMLEVVNHVWLVAVSNGVDGFDDVAVWWDDGAGKAGASLSSQDDEHFSVDFDGDGAADAATYNTKNNTWRIAFADNEKRAFVNATAIADDASGCSGSTHRAASRGALWCVFSSSAGGAGEMRISGYDVASGKATSQRLHAPTSAGAAKLWVAPTTPGSAQGDAVVLDTAGNVFVAQGRSRGDDQLPLFDDFQLVLRNFTGRAPCGDAELAMLMPSSSEAGASLVCASSGVWYKASLIAGGGGSGATSISPIPGWVTHGGRQDGVGGPRPQGWSTSEDRIPHYYNEYFLASPSGGTQLVPLACNRTRQGTDVLHASPRCLVMPNATQVDPEHFQANAPSSDDGVLNRWQAWKMNYRALLAPSKYTSAKGGDADADADATPRFGYYDSGDLVQARYMFDRLTALGVSFYITDNTNSLGVDSGTTLAATRTLAAFAARYNAEKARRTHQDVDKVTEIKYAVSVGVNPLGPDTDPATLLKMDAQLDAVWKLFYNASAADVASIDGNAGPDAATPAALAGAAFHHPDSNKPLMVLYVNPGFYALYITYVQSNASSPAHRFHLGISNGNNDRAGLYGWMIDRSCGPPNTAETPCSPAPPSFDVGVRPDSKVMYVSPAYGKNESGHKDGEYYYAYGARDVEWYASTFKVAAEACPQLLLVGSVNDYTENNGWWPSECPSCRTGEEKDPFLFWNTTVRGLALVKKQCAGRRPPAPVPAPHVYSARVLEHSVKKDGSALIAAVNGSSDFRYNLNAAYFPLGNGRDGLVLRVCNCSWGHAGHTSAAEQPGCDGVFGSDAKSMWGSTAIAVRQPKHGNGEDNTWTYSHVGPESVIVSGGVDPRITYREKDKTYYLTVDELPYCTKLYTTRTPLNHSSWESHGPIIAADNCTTIKGGASLLVRDNDNHVGDDDGMEDTPAVHFAILATSDTSAELHYATSTDMINWTLRGFFQGGRKGMWDAHGLAAGPQPMRLSTGDYVYFYNTDAGVGSGNVSPYHRCQVGWLIMAGDDPSRVIARGGEPLLSPEMPWELGLDKDYNTNGVIFANGIKAVGNDEFVLFFGGSDTDVGAAQVKVEIK